MGSILSYDPIKEENVHGSYWNKFGTPDTVLSKYGDETSAYWLWWIDRDSEADLSDAMKEDLLPKEPSVYFDEMFSE